MVLEIIGTKNLNIMYIDTETEYRCPDPNCEGVMIERHASGSAHWLECDCCGETYSFYEFFTSLESE